MFFRKANIRCIDCRRFVPDKDDPNRGTCHIIEITDAGAVRDCRWFEPVEGEQARHNPSEAEPAQGKTDRPG